MSIADKLTYLNTTKQLLKTEINKINNVLDDNSTFRSYPQELFNGYLDVLNNGTDTLWSNLEKVSQTGTEAVLENVETAPMKIDLKGNTSQEADPTPDDPKDIKVVKGENVVSVSGKNLINQAELLSSLTYNSATGYYEGTPSSQFKQEIRLNFKENTSYTFRCEAYQDASSGDALQFYVYYKNGTNSHINLANTTTSTIFKITSTASQTIDYLELKYIRARNIHIKDMCLVEGNDISYVPYSKTDYPINLGDIELCKINTYKDYFHKDSGKWYVHKEIGKAILDGSENWVRAQHGTTGNYYYRYANSGLGQQTQDGKLVYSNYFSPKNAWNERVQGIWFDINLLITTNGSLNNTETLEDFISWLSTHNTIVYYVLATPTDTEITNSTLIEQLEAIANAKSVKDKTYITQTNDSLPFILDVEAIKEYEVV